MPGSMISFARVYIASVHSMGTRDQIQFVGVFLSPTFPQMRFDVDSTPYHDARNEVNTPNTRPPGYWPDARGAHRRAHWPWLRSVPGAKCNAHCASKVRTSSAAAHAGISLGATSVHRPSASRDMTAVIKRCGRKPVKYCTCFGCHQNRTVGLQVLHRGSQPTLPVPAQFRDRDRVEGTSKRTPEGL